MFYWWVSVYFLNFQIVFKISGNCSLYQSFQCISSSSGGILTREVSELTESFVMSVGLGDDFIMRLSVKNTEEMRAQLFNVLQSCRLPKVTKVNWFPLLKNQKICIARITLLDQINVESK